MMIPPTHTNNNQISLLYVDDEPCLLDLGKLYLERTGKFKVDIETSPLDILSSSRILSYDAIISDYQMPQMDGIQFLKQVRQKFGDIPFILFSGRGRDEVIIDAINNGADFYLQKSGDSGPLFAELSHKIQQAVLKKRAEQSVKDLNKHLLDFIDFLPDATFAINRSGQVIAWNKSIEIMTGITAEEMLGKGNYEYASPFYGTCRPILIDLINEPDETITQFYSHLYRDEQSVIGESELPRPKGNQITVMAKACKFFSETGEHIGAIESIRDISEFKKSEQKLYDSEKRFRNIIERSSDLTFILDDELKFNYVSPSVFPVLGYEPEEFMKSQQDFVSHPIFSLSKQEIQDVISQIKMGEIVEDIEIQISRIDGILLFVNLYAVPIYQDAELHEFQVSMRVVSGRKLIENKLLESEEKFRAVVNQSLDGIIIIDFSGTILYGNPRFGEIMGHSHVQDLVGSSDVFSYLLPLYQDIAEKDLEEVKGRTDRYPVEYQVRTCDNRIIWVECIGKEILFGGNSCVLLSVHDITERKAAENSLHESEKNLQTIFMNSPVPITIVSAQDGTFVQVNKAFERETGFLCEKVIGRTAEEIGIFPDRNQVKKIITAFRNQIPVHGMEMTCKIASGEKRTCLFSSSYIMLKEKPHILSSIEDITDRKFIDSFNKAILQSISRDNQNSLDNIIQTISIFLDADGVMIGEIQPDGSTLKTLSMILDGKKGKNSSYNIRGTPCERTIENGFCFYPDHSSSLFPESINLVELNIQGFIGVSLRNSSGRIFGTLCILFRRSIKKYQFLQETLEVIAAKIAADIERNHLEQELRKNQVLLSEAMNMANLVHWEYDINSEIFTFNDSFYSLYGTNPSSEGGNQMSVEMYMREFVHPADLCMVQEEIKKGNESGSLDSLFYLEHRIIRRDMETRYISVRVQRVKNEDGRIIKLLGANQDITERKRSEEAIRKANRQLGLLSSITRHDILNKISSIQGYLAVMESENCEPDFHNYLERMKSVTHVIHSQIEFTKVYQDIGSHEPQWIQLSSIMPVRFIPNEVIFTTEHLHFRIFADPMLEKVFFNLLDNSLTHGQQVTRIHVSAYESTKDLIILWEDDGTGIISEDKEKVFERGFGKNTGLGMFLAKEILSLTDISIKETGIYGKGARFEITVPRGTYMI